MEVIKQSNKNPKHQVKTRNKIQADRHLQITFVLVFEFAVSSSFQQWSELIKGLMNLSTVSKRS